MHDGKKQAEHYNETLAFVREKLPNLTDEVLEQMAATRHTLVIAATGADLPPWERLDDAHKLYERVNVVYSLAAGFSWSVLQEAFTVATGGDFGVYEDGLGGCDTCGRPFASSDAASAPGAAASAPTPARVPSPEGT